MASKPSRRTASRSFMRYSPPADLAIDDDLPQQAGRSAANLAAQQSVQSLRQARRPARVVPSRSPSTPTQLRKDGHPLSSSSGKVEHNSRKQDENRRRPPHEPAEQRQSKTTISNSNSSSASNSAETAGEAVVSLYSSEARNPRHFKSTPVIKVTIPTSEPDLSSALSPPSSPFALYSPRSVRDLGSDYTRYYNPFTLSNHSQQTVSSCTSTTHLMPRVPGNSSSPAEASRRLSNPFGDSKRISNPFEPAVISAPNTRKSSRASSFHERNKIERTLARAPRPGTPFFAQDGDPEKPHFFQYIDDRLGAPDYAFPLITDQKEDDDDMHMPRDDDDIRLKPRLRDHFSRDNIVSTFGLALMVAGLLTIFLILPVLSYTGLDLLDLGDGMPGSQSSVEPWAFVNDRVYPLLRNVRQGLIDPDTPSTAMTRVGVDGEELVLVFSDEFNEPNRTFYEGDDAYWFGFEGWYGATNDLEWYDPDAINTGGGTLQLQMDQFESHNLSYRSGMLNSWNQLCFKGGVFEVSMSLPGPAGVHGLWPGVWTMGNLGRPGYLATTDGLWPYTYSECDAGITHNQSDPSGISFLPGQRLASCTCADEEHPSPGIGRGAPEIDIAEVSADWGGLGIGVATQSFQVAPFDIWYYPNYDFMQTPNYSLSMVNSYTGGPYQQAVSTTTMLNNAWYDGQTYQKFAFEYVPGGDENAFIAWTIGEEEMMRFDARAIGLNGNVGQRLVSEEPMSMILNLGISNSWTDVEYWNLRFPTVLRVDYVRWYQRRDRVMVTCDPPGYETTEYIAKHPAAYRNSNVTLWEEAGYRWPRNSLVHGCGS